MSLDWESGLLIYGPLGVIAVIALVVIKVLYSEAKADRKTAADQALKQEERHTATILGLLDRYHEHANAMRELLDRLVQRIDDRRDAWRGGKTRDRESGDT